MACSNDSSTIWYVTCNDAHHTSLVIILVILSTIGWVLYHVYLSANKFRESESERISRNNVVFTKDGIRVGVKHIQNEKYVDATQSWVVKAWNLAVGDAQLTRRKK